MPYHTDKGTGIKEMIDYYGIQQEETLVIGDSDNDRAMFNFGHHTVAMKNARQEIKILQMILPNTRTKKMVQHIT